MSDEFESLGKKAKVLTDVKVPLKGEKIEQVGGDVQSLKKVEHQNGNS